ncbi:hypothetical protein AMIS_41770 [Actinoplanes missouriensis 431]|uniref:Secreted protein n=1 Tax=Actinoplanes missouriensis (strain ATCC 14538 / DSM 43046 / CBS 188.64 / JCM 3121 / NBRC 102363 / NCIMB 12654 / NRRL B-3342 / UNCC 431) TaxID=512565 RepID=I0H8R0_ACTM4|nr:hypothetical protein [Actinoplanes missouriensis]BAL89397.1 hypothetical protein AMIS_41770 [Actinoplanes missouriensis 431]
MWAQVLTLAGVLLGGSISYVFTSRLERARNQREMVIRWDVRKYEAFVEYLSAVTRMARTSGQLVRARGWDTLAAEVEPEAGRRTLDDFESARTAAYERVVMLADETCIAAADELNTAVWKLEWFGRGVVDDCSKEDWREALSVYTAALDRFQQAARANLVVPGVSLTRRIERPLPVPRRDGDDTGISLRRQEG